MIHVSLGFYVGGMVLMLVGCGLLALFLGAGFGYALAAGRCAVALEELAATRRDLQRLQTASATLVSAVSEPAGEATVANLVPEEPAESAPVAQPAPVIAPSADESADESADLSTFVAAAPHAGALLIADIDFLGQFREKYGAALSEFVSNHVERVMREALSGMSAVISRYEEHEFLVALPETPGTPAERLLAARRQASELRAEIERNVLQVGSERLTVTATLGLALVEASVPPEEIIAQADEALHIAKRTGKNIAYYRSLNGECWPVDPLPPSAAEQASSAPAASAAPELPSGKGKVGCRDRRRHERRPCPTVNLMAPCSDNVLPSMDKFERVQFLDLSISGFSMILPAVPTSSRFAIALFNTRGMIFMSAEVANVRQAPRVGQGKPLVIVGCQFRQRLYPTQPMTQLPATTKPVDPALAAILQSL